MRHTHSILLAVCLLCAASQNAAAQNRTTHNTVTPSDVTDTRTPGESLRRARTLHIEPGRAVDAGYLQYKLLRTDAFTDWGISIVEDPAAADLVLKVEQARLNYIFRITDPRTSQIVTSGKVVAVNDPIAADFLGKEIIKRMREARRAQ